MDVAVDNDFRDGSLDICSRVVNVASIADVKKRAQLRKRRLRLQSGPHLMVSGFAISPGQQLIRVER